MKKRDKIIYWIATIWLAFGMSVSGVAQIMQTKDEVALFNTLHYPTYFMVILGVWKMLGVIAVLVPKFPVVKEWAYAGFFIAMSGAAISHLVVGTAPIDLFGPVLTLVLISISWYFRPADRRLATNP